MNKVLYKEITFKPIRKGGKTIHLRIELSHKEYVKPKRNYINLEPVNSGTVLSICGSRRKNTGFCQVDDFEKYIPFYSSKDKEKASKLLNIWKNYHLNDLQAGTLKQTIALKECDSYDYNDRLESLNLLNDKGFRYGTDWLFKPIPDSIIEYLHNV